MSESCSSVREALPARRGLMTCGNGEVGCVSRLPVWFVGNSWSRKPNGEDYAAILGDAQVARLKPLQERHTAMLMDAAERWGWK